MTVAGQPPPRDRLSPFVAALRTRVERLRSPSPAAAALVEQLAALAAGDEDLLASTLDDQLVVRVWGWTPGGRWSWDGQAARRAVTLQTLPAPVITMRIDVDRFFPGADVVGLDGDLSWLIPDSAVAAGSGIEPAAVYLVSRRVAIFASFRSGRLASVDVYADVHETVAVSDRSS